MKKFVVLFSILYAISPLAIFASQIEEDILETFNTKYYKTVTIQSSVQSFSNETNNNSYTVEISRDEYESYNPMIDANSTTIETTYKKMTTSISKVDSHYRYTVTLEWKNIPKVRSYDTIAIGFPSSVKVATTPIFAENYCVTNDDCYTSTGYKYSYVGSNGVGVTFQVPTGNLSSLNQKMYFDVEKNTQSTILRQFAYGDYAHATSSVTLSDSKKYTVGTTGIVFESGVINKYDAIDCAETTWSGNW